jgi:hypothetical protein
LPIASASNNDRWRSFGESRTSIPSGRFADPVAITYETLLNQWKDSEDDSVEDALLECSAVLPADWNSGDPVSPAYTVPMLGALAEAPLPLGSIHSGVVHGVFADGRVVAINHSIDRQLFSRIGIRNDAQPLVKPLVQID